jgi:Uma2 family endonuclease
MATAATRPYTIEDWKALPEGRPYFEYEEGELIPMASPTPEHQDVVNELGYLLRHFVQQQQSGRVFVELDVFLPDGRGFIPDFSFLSTGRLHLVDPIDRKIHGAPDMVGEVTSSDPARDRQHKFQVYYANGVMWYWLIDAETLAVEEYQAAPQGYQLVTSAAGGAEFRSQAFPGFAVNLAALLGPPLSPCATASGHAAVPAP